MLLVVAFALFNCVFLYLTHRALIRKVRKSQDYALQKLGEIFVPTTMSLACGAIQFLFQGKLFVEALKVSFVGFFACWIIIFLLAIHTGYVKAGAATRA